jgi:fructose-specific phosphotransferase system IIC component
MARTRIHTRLVVLGGAVTGTLTVLWGLAYSVGTGGRGDILLVVVPLALGPIVGAGTAVVAMCLAGHPAGRATKDDNRPPAIPARGVR